MAKLVTPENFCAVWNALDDSAAPAVTMHACEAYFHQHFVDITTPAVSAQLEQQLQLQCACFSQAALAAEIAEGVEGSQGSSGGGGGGNENNASVGSSGSSSSGGSGSGTVAAGPENEQGKQEGLLEPDTPRDMSSERKQSNNNHNDHQNHSNHNHQEDGTQLSRQDGTDQGNSNSQDKGSSGSSKDNASLTPASFLCLKMKLLKRGLTPGLVPADSTYTRQCVHLWASANSSRYAQPASTLEELLLPPNTLFTLQNRNMVFGASARQFLPQWTA